MSDLSDLSIFISIYCYYATSILITDEDDEDDENDYSVTHQKQISRKTAQSATSHTRERVSLELLFFI